MAPTLAARGPDVMPLQGAAGGASIRVPTGGRGAMGRRSGGGAGGRRDLTSTIGTRGAASGTVSSPEEPGTRDRVQRKEKALLTHLVTALTARLQSDEGATMVEYGIMVALIAVVSILVVAAIGTDLFGAFTNVETQLP